VILALIGHSDLYTNVMVSSLDSPICSLNYKYMRTCPTLLSEKSIITKLKSSSSLDNTALIATPAVLQGLVWASRTKSARDLHDDMVGSVPAKTAFTACTQDCHLLFRGAESQESHLHQAGMACTTHKTAIPYEGISKFTTIRG
jgi:hypothetical protein